MKTIRITGLVFLLVGLCAASANADYVCRHGESTREIKIVYEVEGQKVPCAVVYMKEGNEQTLWKAQSEQGYCESKAEAFVEKQRGWGWECNEPATAEFVGTADEIAPAAEQPTETTAEAGTEE